MENAGGVADRARGRATLAAVVEVVVGGLMLARPVQAVTGLDLPLVDVLIGMALSLGRRLARGGVGTSAPHRQG